MCIVSRILATQIGMEAYELTPAYIKDFAVGFITNELKLDDLSLMENCYTGIDGVAADVAALEQAVKAFNIPAIQAAVAAGLNDVPAAATTCKAAKPDLTRISSFVASLPKNPKDLESLVKKNLEKHPIDAAKDIEKFKKDISANDFEDAGEIAAALVTLGLGKIPETLEFDSLTAWKINRLDKAQLVQGFLEGFFTRDHLVHLAALVTESAQLKLDATALYKAVESGAAMQELLIYAIPVYQDVQGMVANAQQAGPEVARAAAWGKEFMDPKTLVPMAEKNFMTHLRDIYADAARISGDIATDKDFLDLGDSVSDLVTTIFGAIAPAAEKPVKKHHPFWPGFMSVNPWGFNQ
jgi:hypothetical protein